MKNYIKRFMKYLLIDFGASFIKSIIYNKDTDTYSDPHNVISPFQTQNEITKQELLLILQELIPNNIDGILICSILGGYYENDIYHSWKKKCLTKNYCLISGLFSNINTFHIHKHHQETTHSEFYETGLKILGYINDIPIYSALADTLCVVESLNIGKNDVIVNIGTGSQVITQNSKHSFIPAGRAFFTFNEFFKSLGLNMFDMLKAITIEDVNNSDLIVDLNTFPQAINYHKNIQGGHILGIIEGNFNVTNLLGSILKNFVEQYKEYILNSGCNNIILTGGIPKKLPIIKQLFEVYYPSFTIIQDVDDVENTHKGMVLYIKKYL
jgi:hypothetical protein